MMSRRSGIGHSAALALVLFAAAVTALGFSASADPVGTIESPGRGIGFLGLAWFVIACVNLPINLLLYSMPLALLCRRFGRDVGNLPESDHAFVTALLVVVLIISSVGAAIDILLVADSSAIVYWIGAIALIMLSSVIASGSMLELKRLPNLLQSGFMALINPVFWVVLTSYEVEVSSTNFLWVLLPLCSLGLSLVSLWILRGWHGRTYAPISRLASRMPRNIRTTGIAAVTLMVTVAVVSVTLYIASPPDMTYGSPPTTSLKKIVVPSSVIGVRFTFESISKTTPWSDISIILGEGNEAVRWDPRSEDYSTGSGAIHAESPVGGNALGSILVWCNITDVIGNGNVNGGDYFTLATGSQDRFDSTTVYSVTLVFGPSSDVFYRTNFTG